MSSELKFIILLLLQSFNLQQSSSIEISCTYKTKTDWWAIDNVYFCEQDIDIDINRSNSVVTAIEGVHSEGKTNSDIKGFRVDNKRLRYFPQELNDFVGDLEFIAIWEAGLREIHQRDLAPFTSLKVLSVWKNDIETLERNLLKFNKNIEYIGLGQNKITKVDGKIFSHLSKLHSLHFDGNNCLSRQAAGNTYDVWDLVEEIEEQC